MIRRQPQIFNIPPGVPFARSLCEGIIERFGNGAFGLADTLVLVPTRRSARALRDGFADAISGAALLPRIVALADVEGDYDGSDLPDSPESLPVISPVRRQLLLATLVQHWGAARGAPIPLHQALNSAAELGALLDEAITNSADLSRLSELAPADLAAHWNEVISFLNIIAVQWPKLLEAENAIEAAANRDSNLRSLAHRFREMPPATPVIAAGSTGSIPATAELLKTIAFLPAGALVLPGLDTTLDANAWETLDASHPQYGLNRLLAQIGVSRDAVLPWSPLPELGPQRECRVRFLSEALRPPPTTDAWRDLIERSGGPLSDALGQVSLIEARTSRQEAVVIACAMREALETPGRTAALVTPDRALGRRVAAELSRWDIAIDDSAGVPLSDTEPGAYLVLLARAAAERMSPLQLLALLKHPLAAGGDEPGWFRHRVRQLETVALRGIAPESGLAGVAARLERKSDWADLRSWFAKLSNLLEGFAVAIAKPDAELGEIAQMHAAAAEGLARTRSKTGAQRLWSGPAGEAAAGLLNELARDGAGVSLHPARDYAEVFRQLAQCRPVRPDYNLHPRLAILGPLEARLLDFDLVILGGLNEGTWPGVSATDPWLSRPMRLALGLESPERRIGLSAHDFATLSAARTVLLTRSEKENGSPAVASRWLLRLKQLASGLGIESMLSNRSELLQWAIELDRSPPVERASRPAPSPPVAVRPHRLSVTEIEKWIRDPYAIYAKHVLRLKPFDPVDQEPGPAQRGIAIHRVMERFLTTFPHQLPSDALEEMLRLGRQAFVEAGAGPSALALWMPRFERAASWFVDYESKRRKVVTRSFVEVRGQWQVPSAFGFELRGRADRIDLFANGSAAIIDYKSGRLPSNSQIEHLLSPQLPLEGAMLLAGAFGEIAAPTLREFVHVQLTGGDPAGRAETAKQDPNELAGEARRLLEKLVARYEQHSEPYRSRVAPFKMREAGDYDHLARVTEWWLFEAEP